MNKIVCDVTVRLEQVFQTNITMMKIDKKSTLSYRCNKKQAENWSS